ncbi:hypothetical protein [Umezawaea beigongshangensis]|uniref:hypothetical protein n=1 Tax=Umezawaea beigongshangensis TaxID=2780383 RepID=UPI0018F23F42|nr:hypothetical protein [Umezawaea beigongshangensis]
MTRTASDDTPTPSEPEVPDGRDGTTSRIALGAAACGALLLVAGPLVGVADVPAAFTSWPLLTLLAVLPVAVAAVLLARGLSSAAAAVLIASAVFAPGRLLLDLQTAADAFAASRPELLRPTSLEPISAASGAWVLVAGHVLVLVAGALAATAGGVLVEQDDPDEQSGQRGRFGRAAAVGVVALVALLTTPFSSTDPFLLARGPLDSPGLAVAGGLLIALAAPVAGALAALSSSPSHRRWGLAGTALALAAVALPPLVAGLVAADLGVTWGPVVVLLAAAGFAALAVAQGREESPQDRTALAAGAPLTVELAGQQRLQTAAGALGLLAGVLAVAGGLTSQIVVPEGVPAPEHFAGRPLLPAGVVVGLLGLALLVRASASAARPAFVVALAALPLAASSALDAVLAATSVVPSQLNSAWSEPDALRPGTGAWLTVAALVLGVLAAAFGTLAGAVEREETGGGRQRSTLPLIATGGVAALLAIGAFTLPALRADDFVAPAVSDLGTASWGLLVALLTVLAAVGFALVSRPPRAAALLLGAALVVGVKALELPLTGARVAGAVPGPGTWLAAASVVALVVAATTSLSRR